MKAKEIKRTYLSDKTAPGTIITTTTTQMQNKKQRAAKNVGNKEVLKKKITIKLVNALLNASVHCMPELNHVLHAMNDE